VIGYCNADGAKQKKFRELNETLMKEKAKRKYPRTFQPP
jgi:hypothetical protein